MRASCGRILVVVGTLCVAAGLLHQPAFAQWRPWGDDVFESRADAQRRSRAREAPPSTRESVLVSRATDRAIGLAIERYRAIAGSGGWQRIPSGPKLDYGARDPRVAYLRRRLQITGDLPESRRNAQSFDGHVSAAVQRFQRRHGLTPSGEVNRFTLKALNVSARHRLQQLRLNRKRLRHLLARTEGKRYVLVNIPSFELQAVSSGRLNLSSRVVVGRPATPTPEVSARIRAVNLLPYWHVPQSIAKRMLIPTVKKDPGYLAREHIRVFSSWGGAELDPSRINWWAPQGQRLVFRQDAGPFNALGVIRLDMPNRHIVYLHDTPLKKLFKYYLRPYSAGCVRVAEIGQLASWVLRDESGWSARRIDQVVRSGQPQTVPLKRPVPVHFAYLSAWASGAGQAHFRIDIYGKDGAGRRTAQSGSWQAKTRRVAP